MGPDAIRAAGPDGLEQKIGWVREAAGDRFGQIVLEVGAYFAAIGPEARSRAETVGTSMGLTADEMCAHPHALFGSVDEVCATLIERRERWGISYVAVPDAYSRDFAPVVARLAGT
jgi:hypothetical protein